MVCWGRRRVVRGGRRVFAQRLSVMEAIIGPMFSGKTAELVGRVKDLRDGGVVVRVVEVVEVKKILLAMVDMEQLGC